MDLSFYIAAAGANAQQTRMDIIANNFANVQTEGYKAQSAGFVDLLYQNYYKAVTKDPQTGCGARVEKTDILYEQGGVMPTDGKYDFAIMGSGFFGVYDNSTGDVYYTRNGNFSLSDYGGGMMYLVNEQGYLILDKNMDLITPSSSDNADDLNIGVFDFANREGFLLKGNNCYQPVDKNGDPFLNENAVLLQGKLEMANVDLAKEMTRVIESQRAYQMSLKMLQTSDEIESTINNLR